MHGSFYANSSSPAMLQHSAAQHSTAQRSTAQHSAAQHSTAQRSTAQHSTAQHSTAQHSTAQHSTAQHSMRFNFSVAHPSCSSVMVLLESGRMLLVNTMRHSSSMWVTWASTTRCWLSAGKMMSAGSCTGGGTLMAWMRSCNSAETSADPLCKGRSAVFHEAMTAYQTLTA